MSSRSTRSLVAFFVWLSVLVGRSYIISSGYSNSIQEDIADVVAVFAGLWLSLDMLVSPYTSVIFRINRRFQSPEAIQYGALFLLIGHLFLGYLLIRRLLDLPS